MPPRGRDDQDPRDAQFNVDRRIADYGADGVLDLSDLGIREVPKRVRGLKGLLRLRLERNLIEALPGWIDELEDLERLELWQNPLATIPGSIGRLRRLTRLIIDGQGHDLQAVRGLEHLAELVQLTELGIAYLSLKEVPAWVRRLTALTGLWLQGNPLRRVPSWLAELGGLSRLYLRATGTSSLPASFRQFPSLRLLDVNDNPALQLPPEVVSDRVAGRILAYYFLTEDPATRQPLNEFKLILLGRGGVGKTTLVHRLDTGKYKVFKQTPGIKISKLAVDIEGEPVRAHVWDFGGQEIMHGTHRFFMTERAVYALLLSGREGAEDRDAEYWLALVRSFAGAVPVMVCLNKWSEHRLEVNRVLLQKKHGPLVFVETDSKSGHGIAEMRGHLSALARGLDGLKARWPSAWRRIKEELPRRKTSWLTFDDFRRFCGERGVAERTEQEQLADALHDLGLMLSYRHDDTLRRFGVLHPQWVTQGIYEMLNARALRDVGGVFTLKSFGDVLSETRYPSALHEYLLALMLRFGLCHPLDTKGKKFLIPELLGKEEPSLDEEFPPGTSLGFSYHYDNVLPEGLLPRFIVESYVHREPARAWRTGAVLELGECRAMVRGDVQGRTVSIRVVGPVDGRRRLLGIIREHFERIHASYEKLEVKGKVPVPGMPEVLLDHTDLLTFERAGEELITFPVGTRLIRLPVKDLLDNVDLPGARRPDTGLDGNLRAFFSLAEGSVLEVFVAYARTDGVYLDELKAALIPHQRRGEIALWADVLVGPGELWQEEILRRLRSARIVVLLLSTPFLGSWHCMEQELPIALDRRARGECEVVPVLVRECRYDKDQAISALNIIRPGNRPVAAHRRRDPAWEEVTHRLDDVIKRLQGPARRTV